MAQALKSGSGQEQAGITLTARRYPYRWVGAAVILFILAWAAQSVVTNPRFQWHVTWQYFFSDEILSGLGVTLELTVISMALSIVFGTLLAVMRMSRNPVMATISYAYIWLFRAVPTLVLVIVIFNISALYPSISFGIPFGPRFFTGNANDVVTALMAGVIGLFLSESAYEAEIIRGGITGIDHGQTDAALALGMTRAKVMRRIVLPQAARIVVPAIGNQFVGMLKNTTLLSVVAVGDLLYSAEKIYDLNFRPIPLLMVATIWYAIVVSVFMLGQRYLEKAIGRGHRPASRGA